MNFIATKTQGHQGFTKLSDSFFLFVYLSDLEP